MLALMYSLLETYLMNKFNKKGISRGGGISIYIRDSMKFKERKDVPFSYVKLTCLEAKLLNSKPFITIALYRPSNSSHVRLIYLTNLSLQHKEKTSYVFQTL